MARIQGADFGGNRFKGSARSIDVTPVKAASSDKAIKGYREQVTRNQKTQNREQERQFKVENLEQKSTDAIDRAAQKVSFQLEKDQLRAEQLKEKGDLKLEQQQELDQLKLETSWISARDQLNVATVAAQGQFASAKLAFIGNTINSLLDFGGSVVKYGEFKYAEQQREKEHNDRLNWIQGSGSSGIQAELQQMESTQRQIEVAGETAIRRTTDNPIIQEELRGPQADARAEREFSQMSTRDFGTSLYGGLKEFMDSQTIIADPDGNGTFSVNNPTTYSQVDRALRFGISKLFRDANVAGMDSYEASRTVYNKTQEVFSNLQRHYYAKIDKARKENRLFKVESNFFSKNASGQFPVPEMFQDLSEAYQVTAGLSQTEANKKAYETLKNYYQSTDNETKLEALLDVQQVPGQKGTELRYMYGEEIQDAIFDTQSDITKLRAADAANIETSMYEQLQGVEDPEQRISIIADAINHLESKGHHQKAKALASDLKKSKFSNNALIGDALIKQRIREGEIKTIQQLDNELATGGITQAGYDDAAPLLEQTKYYNMPKDEGVKRKLTATHKAVADDLLRAAGFKRSATGELVIDPTMGDTSFATRAEMRRIVQQAQDDLTYLTNEFIAQNPGIENKPRELSAAILDLHNNWLVENLQTPGGKFYIQDILDGDKKGKGAFDSSTWSDEQRNRIRNFLSDGERFATLQSSTMLGGSQNLAPIDWSVPVDLEGNITDYAIKSYNPLRGDTLISGDTYNRIYQKWQQGEVDDFLQELSVRTGRSPLRLLNESTSSPLTPNNKLFPVTLPATELSSSTAPLAAVEGAQMLMQAGFPPRGAAWLAGNIQQESSWDGQRQPWGQVMGDGTYLNKGLVSWASWSDDPARVGRIESYLGKPIEQATNAEQIQALKWELETFYGKAWDIFTNSYASERQLMRASEMYWGFGHEGDRYGYARDIERQLRN